MSLTDHKKETIDTANEEPDDDTVQRVANSIKMVNEYPGSSYYRRVAIAAIHAVRNK